MNLANAKPGDKFKTRNGKQAVFSCKIPTSPDGEEAQYPYMFWIKNAGVYGSFSFTEKGTLYWSGIESERDIVAPWPEPEEVEVFFFRGTSAKEICISKCPSQVPSMQSKLLGSIKVRIDDDNTLRVSDICHRNGC